MKKHSKIKAILFCLSLFLFIVIAAIEQVSVTVLIIQLCLFALSSWTMYKTHEDFEHYARIVYNKIKK